MADSRRLESFLSPNSVDLILTGPPYFNEIVYSDDAAQLSEISDYQTFLQELGRVWKSCAVVLKEGGIMTVWVHDFLRKEQDAWRYIPFHADTIKTMPDDLVLKTITVWDRYLSGHQSTIPATAPVGTRLQYLIILQKHGVHELNSHLIDQSLKKHYWEPVWHYKTHPELLGSRVLFRLARSVVRPFKRLFPEFITRIQTSFSISDPNQFRYYLTECPEKIAERCIREFSKPGDLVVDPFIGSGTTLKMALKLNRKCVGFDINEQVIGAISRKVGLDGIQVCDLRNSG